ncbi:MAG: winged helix-turn-helix transcriptional regulator [Candidatus Hodarchaeota archaeon]
MKGQKTLVPDETINDYTSSIAEIPFNISKLERKILAIAKDLMKKHYTLDPRALYFNSLRMLKKESKSSIISAIEGLLKKKIFFPGKALTKDELFQNDTRKQIYKLIKEQPGIYFSKIRNILEKGSQVILFHLKILEQFKAIKIENFNGNKACFVTSLENQLAHLFYYLNKENTITILNAIVTTPGLSFIELLKQLDIPRTTLMRKIKILEKKGFLEVIYESNQLIYLELKPVYVPPVLEFIHNSKKYV